MSAPTPSLPRCPADLDGDHTLADLVDAYARHVLVLAAARTGGHPVPADRLAAHTVAALVTGHVVVADLHVERWPVVRDGLAHGPGTTSWPLREGRVGLAGGAHGGSAGVLAVGRVALPREGSGLRAIRHGGEWRALSAPAADLAVVDLLAPLRVVVLA
jgi:hypothetical protein